MEKEFAKEYATALFDLSLEKNQTEIIKDELIAVATIIKENQEFIKLLTHPQLSKDEKIAIIKKVFNGLNESLLHFLYVVVNNDRFNDIQSINEGYSKLYNEYNKVIQVKAITTIDLDKKQIETLENKLKVKYRHKIEIENIIDSSIVAGVRLIINNDVIDYSVKTQMNNLKSHILKQT